MVDLLFGSSPISRISDNPRVNEINAEPQRNWPQPSCYLLLVRRARRGHLISREETRPGAVARRTRTSSRRDPGLNTERRLGPAPWLCPEKDCHEARRQLAVCSTTMSSSTDQNTSSATRRLSLQPSIATVEDAHVVPENLTLTTRGIECSLYKWQVRTPPRCKVNSIHSSSFIKSSVNLFQSHPTGLPFGELQWCTTGLALTRCIRLCGMPHP